MLKYHLIKDILLLLIIAAIGACGWKAYNHYTEKIKDFEMSLTKMGTGISIDNQRKAKIQKAAEMIKSVNDKLPYEIAMNYAEWFVDEADKYQNVDFVLLISIASQESHFRHKAKSPVGARGLMQMMPGTAMDMCEYLRMTYADSILFDPKTNIRLGAKYVNKMMTLFNNDEHAVIASYNGGEGGGRKYKAYKNGKMSADAIAKETLDYVPKVLKFKSKFEGMM